MSAHRNFWSSSSGMIALCMIAVIGYFLLMEHRDHLFQALPYLILLACPLMHVFMHGSHSHGGHAHGRNEHSGQTDQEKDSEEAAYRRGLEEGRRIERKRSNHEDRG